MVSAIAKELHISIVGVELILPGSFHVSAGWVSQNVSTHDRHWWAASSQELLGSYTIDKELFCCRLVTGDKTWIYHWAPLHTCLTALFPGLPGWAGTRKVKPNRILLKQEAVASAGHMQVCTSLQTDNHACTSPLSFLQAGCPSCRPTNSIKALKANIGPH